MHIFSERRVSELFEINTASLADRIKKEKDAYLLKVDQGEYVSSLVDIYCLEEVELLKEERYSTVLEKDIPAEVFPRSFHVREGKSYPTEVIMTFPRSLYHGK